MDQIVQDNPRNNLDIISQEVKILKRLLLLLTRLLRILLAPEFQEQIPLR